MDTEYFISGLSNSVKNIGSIISNISEDEAHWKPQPKKWSVVEVLNHLYDEEKDDFRMRLDLTLNNSESRWPEIDPEKWAEEREYNKKNFQQSAENFFDERAKSLDWLNTLVNPDWNKSYQHPKIGYIYAGELLAAWLAHDFFHLRQLSNLKIQYLEAISEPYSIRYASP